MTVVRYPTLRLSANGASVLLDTVTRGFVVYEVPGLRPRFGRDSYENVQDVSLSSSGSCAAIRTREGGLVVLDETGDRAYRLPHPPERIRSLAISDAGDSVALLVVESEPVPEESSTDNGRLEIWSLPAGSAPSASCRLPLFGGGTVSANASAARLGVYSATTLETAQFIGVYDRQDDGTLAPLWVEWGPSLARITVTVGGDWAWAVEPGALVGWCAGEPPVRLPGSLGDRLVFAPDYGHLLAYCIQETVAVTSVRVLFRLFDLATLAESRRVSHVIEDDVDAHFALSGDLSLLELRATREGGVVGRELGW